MELFIPKDYFLNPTTPRLFLCSQSGTRIQELQAYDVNLTAKWNSWSELSLSQDRFYVDIITGETKVHPAFDKLEGLRTILADNIGLFCIQDPSTVYGDKDTKNISAFSIEHSLGARYLSEWKINTGEVDSKEVIYLSDIYGDDYGMNDDERYIKVSGSFDIYGSYYYKNYTDNNSYVYEQIQIKDATDYAKYDGSTVEKTLYVKKYENVRFYYPTKQGLSLLHLIFAEIPDWTIGNVDASLWRKERKFDESRVAIYDFMVNTMADTFKCVCEFDSIAKRVNFYAEEDDGLTEDGEVQSKYETDIYISRDNLASQIDVSYSTDDIKTRLKVSGADNLDIREINLGQNHIMNLDYFHNLDWMEQDLFEAYDDYIDAVAQYSPLFTEAVQKRVAAYNKWNDLMNAVPADGNVVLVGDPFEKLYCTYNLYGAADEFIADNTPTYYVMNTDKSYSVADPQPTAETFVKGMYYIQGDEDSVVAALRKKLNLYHVDEDVNASQTDNILLRLKNGDEDVATIRIYDLKQKDSGTGFNPNMGYYTREQQYNGSYKYTKVYVTDSTYVADNPWYVNNYKIQIAIVRASSGITETPVTRSLNQWVRGDLRVSNNISDVGLFFLDGFKVSYIGTMGAYFVLTKDETQPENLQDYGIKLLQEKQEVYTTIFQTQTEAMFSQEKYQCIASETDPAESANPPIGTRWLDTGASPVVLYERTASGWKESTGDLSDYENYARYKDNYDKLKAVQEVLFAKEKIAEYCLNGYAVNTRSIDVSKYTPGVGQSLEADMQRAAQEHFATSTITRVSMDTTLPLYTFRTSAYPSDVFVVYLKGKTPYIAYASSVGVHQAQMDYYVKMTDMESFFNEDQWVRLAPLIREDEFTDDNFLLTGYESEEERLEICQQLMDEAAKELKTLSQPSLEFSMSMGNILALPEFAPIVNQFALGNFIRIELRPGLVKKARLLEAQLDFSDLSNFSCTFGNLVTTKSEIDLHAELLSQAISAGKQVATSSSSWQRAVDKSNSLEEAIANGLQQSALRIGAASGQAVSWDSTGMHFRKYKDGSTTEYEPEEMAIINNALVATANSWVTSKGVFGKYTVDGVEHWGVLSDAIISGYISGSVIEGGELKIGGDAGQFRVSNDGSVQILGPDNNELYANKSSVDILNEARRFRIEVSYNRSTVFNQPNSTCELTAIIYDWDKDVTDEIIASGAKFNWVRTSSADDSTWNANHANRNNNKITIQNDDIPDNAQISCEIQFDDSAL